MGLSYRETFKMGPVRVTASKSGISYSAGGTGARVLPVVLLGSPPGGDRVEARATAGTVNRQFRQGNESLGCPATIWAITAPAFKAYRVGRRRGVRELAVIRHQT